MYPRPKDELVQRGKYILETVQELGEDEYDGTEESGPGPMLILLPGRKADSIEPHASVLYRVNWDDRGRPLNIFGGEKRVARKLKEAYKKTDGAFVVDGSGLVSPYAYELEPDVEVPDWLPDGGTKTRAGYRTTLLDLEGGEYESELPVLRRYEESWGEHVDAPLPNGRVQWEQEVYDPVALLLHSDTGEGIGFEGGEVVWEYDPVVRKEAFQEISVNGRREEETIERVSLEELRDEVFDDDVWEMLESETIEGAEEARRVEVKKTAPTDD